MNLLTAQVIVLAGAKIEMIGAANKGISLTASELVLENDSVISSRGKDGQITLLRGPFVSIIAQKLSGNGVLSISSEGASYIGDSK